MPRLIAFKMILSRVERVLLANQQLRPDEAGSSLFHDLISIFTKIVDESGSDDDIAESGESLNDSADNLSRVRFRLRT